MVEPARASTAPVAYLKQGHITIKAKPKDHNEQNKQYFWKTINRDFCKDWADGYSLKRGNLHRTRFLRPFESRSPVSNLR